MIIIGSGLIAQSFAAVNIGEVVVFASGVSNSKCLTSDDCEREKLLLTSAIEEQGTNLLIYFSSYSINNQFEINSDYVIHKRNMEEFIMRHSSNYLIVRTSNVVGRRSNSATIFNFLATKIKNEEPFSLWSKSYRNILDVDDLVAMVGECVKDGLKNQIVYLVNPIDISVINLVDKIEFFYNKKAIFSTIDKSSSYIGVDFEYSELLFDRLKIDNVSYIETILKKYYSDKNV